MMNVKEIFCRKSQNGRWGLAIVSETIPRDNMLFPVQVDVTYLGDVAGQEVYRIEKTEKPQWLLVGEDLEPVAGASKIESIDLQGHNCVTLLLLGEEAIVRDYGYRRRSSRVTYYRHGESMDIPESVLLALGLIPVHQEPAVVGPPPAFRVDGEHRGAIAQALIDAGYFEH